MIKKRFVIEGMHCVGCTMAVEGALEDLPGVKSAAANYAKQTAEVEYDEERVTEAQIAEVVKLAGYKVILSAG